MPLFGPPLPCPAVFSDHREFRDFLLVKRKFPWQPARVTLEVVLKGVVVLLETCANNPLCATELKTLYPPFSAAFEDEKIKELCHRRVITRYDKAGVHLNLRCCLKIHFSLSLPTRLFILFKIASLHSFSAVINGEKAAFNTPVFAQKRQRTLDMLIRNIYQDHMPENSKVGQ